MSLPKIEISRENAEELVFALLTEYLDDMIEARKFVRTTGHSTLIHSIDPKEELKELKKDIKALLRVRSYYE